MNKIKVAFVDFWSHFDPDNFILIKALRENHIVEILQNPQEAGYVFFSYSVKSIGSCPTDVLRFSTQARMYVQISMHVTMP